MVPLVSILTRHAAAILVQPPRTLRQFVPRFLQWFALVRGRAPNTVVSYQHDLRTFLQFCERAGLEHPDQVSFREIEVYIGWLRQERGLAESTANRHLNALRTFWRFLTREGFARSNPAADVFSLKEPERLPKYLSIPEQERVLGELAQDRSLCGRRDYALVALALFTGLRVEEITRLRVDDVDLEAGTLRVERGKGGRGRELAVVPRLRMILADYLVDVRPQLVKKPRGHLYAEPAHPLAGRLRQGTWHATWKEGGKRYSRTIRAASEEAARRILDELVPLPAEPPWLFVNASPHSAQRLRRAGEPLLTRSVFHIIRRTIAPRVGRPVGPHTLRHSFASRLRENGADLALIQEALGHASIGTTMVYAHLSSGKQKAELAKYLEG